MFSKYYCLQNVSFSLYNSSSIFTSNFLNKLINFQNIYANTRDKENNIINKEHLVNSCYISQKKFGQILCICLTHYRNVVLIGLILRYSLSRPTRKENIPWIKQYLSRGSFVADSIWQHFLPIGQANAAGRLVTRIMLHYVHGMLDRWYCKTPFTIERYILNKAKVQKNSNFF